MKYDVTGPKTEYTAKIEAWEVRSNLPVRFDEACFVDNFETEREALEYINMVIGHCQDLGLSFWVALTSDTFLLGVRK